MLILILLLFYVGFTEYSIIFVYFTNLIILILTIHVVGVDDVEIAILLLYVVIIYVGVGIGAVMTIAPLLLLSMCLSIVF